MENYEYKKYKVTEEYLGEEIEVNVSECWSSEGIESADISCSYNTIFRGLGHSIENYRPYEYGGVIGEVVKRLSVDDVHDAIFKEIYIAEKSIARSKKEKHDNFYHSRYFRVVVHYKNQEIIIPIMMNSNSDKVWITCPSSALIKGVTMKNDAYIFAIYDEVKNSKKLIDDGYVFAKSSKISKVKKKIKSLF